MWIACKDQEPTVPGNYLVAFPLYAMAPLKVSMAWWSGADWQALAISVITPITHWQDLPSPPPHDWTA